MAIVAVDPTPLLNAHSHNDYEHERPLALALENGFMSVEADIWLEDGKLLVAHERNQVRPDRTLESLYLQPLMERWKQRGSIYLPTPSQPFQLMVDIKADGEAVYRRLKEVLARFKPMLTSWQEGKRHSGAVTIVLSGARPVDSVKAERRRWVALDGRLRDLEAGVDPELYPLISDNWWTTFSWRGNGTMPAKDRERLQGLAERARAGGHRLRFWAAPDREPVWQTLRSEEGLWINTDRPAELRRWLIGSEGKDGSDGSD